MSKFQDIIERLEKATEPDPRLNGLIAMAVGSMPMEAMFMETDAWGERSDTWYLGGFGGYTFLIPDECTASIDAAIALVERMLPDWDLQLFKRQSKGGWMARLKGPRCQLFCTKIVDGEEQRVGTAPIAILLALFRALDVEREVK
jgi:hypothetical protein